MEYGLAALALVQHLIKALVSKGVLSANEASDVYAKSSSLLTKGMEGKEHTPAFDEVIKLLDDIANSASSQPAP